MRRRDVYDALVNDRPGIERLEPSDLVGARHLQITDIFGGDLRQRRIAGTGIVAGVVKPIRRIFVRCQFGLSRPFADRHRALARNEFRHRFRCRTRCGCKCHQINLPQHFRRSIKRPIPSRHSVALKYERHHVRIRRFGKRTDSRLRHRRAQDVIKVIRALLRPAVQKARTDQRRTDCSLEFNSVAMGAGSTVDSLTALDLVGAVGRFRQCKSEGGNQ